MTGETIVLSNKRILMETVYNEGIVNVHQIAAISGMHTSSIYNMLRGSASYVLDFKIKLEHGKRIKFYDLKKDYRIAINDCLEKDVDIFDIIDYPPKDGQTEN